ncbi:MAG: hypothetical protein CMO01_00490 [Thalassobius sp.]|nr:hypothetical protein [Thalassovita sp.]
MSTLKDVFISYGRLHSQDFASRLYERLEEAGFDAWYDFVNIPKGEDFQERIYRGIERSHNFIYIISPHANESQYCLKEIEYAIQCNKRIIPILHIEKELDKIHPEIAKLNWVYARETIESEDTIIAEDNFEKAFLEIAEVIESKRDFTQLHSRILIEALNWENNQKSSTFLLTGKHRYEAEKWLLNEIHQIENIPCEPTELHSEYICESRKNAENLMTDTFISYADEDKNIHEKVRKYLTRYLITSWAHYRDIRKGENFETAILEGIEKANNVLYFISKKSVKSEYCRKELEYATQYNKRIIPLLIENVSEKDFPEQIKGLQFIDFTDNVKENDYLKDIGNLINELNHDKSYYEQHKITLVHALKWQRQNKNASILLRGYNLQSALSFLKTGERKSHAPTQAHIDFIEESKVKTAQLNSEVFISYSRTDGDFARKLNDELQLSGKTTWFDQESIAAAAADFQEEIYKGIASSDNFLFIISERSVISEHCAGEVEHAIQCGKRIITILIEKPESSLHEALAKVNWINFKDNDFHPSFGELLRTLDTDRPYIIQHTKWGQQALEWLVKDKSKDLLLRGDECLLASNWLNRAQLENKNPKPTPIQKNFIETSIEVGKAEQRKKSQLIKRLRVYLIASIITLITTAVFGVYAFHLKNVAEEQKELAIKNQKEILAAKEELDSLYYVLSVINLKYEELLAMNEHEEQSLEITPEKEILTQEIQKLQKGVERTQLERAEIVQSEIKKATEDLQLKKEEDKQPSAKSEDKKVTKSRSFTPLQAQQKTEDEIEAVEESVEEVQVLQDPVAEAPIVIPEEEKAKTDDNKRLKVSEQLEQSIEEAKEEVKEAFKSAKNAYLVTNITGNVYYENGEEVKKGDRISDTTVIKFNSDDDILQLVSPKGRFVFSNQGLVPASRNIIQSKKN